MIVRSHFSFRSSHSKCGLEITILMLVLAPGYTIDPSAEPFRNAIDWAPLEILMQLVLAGAEGYIVYKSSPPEFNVHPQPRSQLY